LRAPFSCLSSNFFAYQIIAMRENGKQLKSRENCLGEG
jgi:hypothetical protein